MQVYSSFTVYLYEVQEIIAEYLYLLPLASLCLCIAVKFTAHIFVICLLLVMQALRFKMILDIQAGTR